MKAIILAAGKSSRLYPITLNKPKCLLNIHGKKLIEHQIELLKLCGIDDILVVTGYLHEKIEKILGKKVRYKYYHRYKDTNNLYTLHSVKNELNEDLIILFSDVLLSKKTLARCIDNEEDYSLIVDTNNISINTMRVIINSDSVKEIGNQIDLDNASGNFIGVAKYSKKGAIILKNHIEKLVKNGKCLDDYYTAALNKISEENININYIDTNKSPWVEIDFEEDYNNLLKRDINEFYN